MKDLKYYLALPYAITIRPDDEGDWIARIEELEGCIAHGSTQAEALLNLDEMKTLWFEDALENGDSISEPETEELPSGKWVQRVPRTIHRKALAAARRDGVSLNLFCATAIAEAVGIKQTLKQEKKKSEHDFETVVKRLVASGADWLYEQRPHQHSADATIMYAEAVESVAASIPNEMGWSEIPQERKKRALEKNLAKVHCGHA